MPRKPKQPFITKVLEQLAELDSLAYKPMFGCFGLYGDSVFFAIVCGEELYFRTDEKSRKEFIKRGMEPFVFREQQRSNNYYRVPDEIFDNPKQLKKWAATAIQAQKDSKGNASNLSTNKETVKSLKSSLKSAKPQPDSLKDLPVLSVVMSVSSALMLTSPAIGAPKTSQRESVKQALELTQTHNLGGNQKLYLAKDAIRLEHANSGMVVIARAPFTEIFVINPTKKMYQKKGTMKTVERMKSVQVFARVMDQLSEVPWGPAREGMISEFKTGTYMKRSPANSWREYTTLKEPVYPKPAIELICAYSSGMPALMGVPLRMEELIVESERDSAIDGKPKKDVIFQTRSIKAMSLPDSLFTLPTDCKKAEGKGNLMDGTRNFRSYQDMMSSPDFMFQSSKEKLRGDQLKKDNLKNHR